MQGCIYKSRPAHFHLWLGVSACSIDCTAVQRMLLFVEGDPTNTLISGLLATIAREDEWAGYWSFMDASIRKWIQSEGIGNALRDVC